MTSHLGGQALMVELMWTSMVDLNLAWAVSMQCLVHNIMVSCVVQRGTAS